VNGAKARQLIGTVTLKSLNKSLETMKRTIEYRDAVQEKESVVAVIRPIHVIFVLIETMNGKEPYILSAIVGTHSLMSISDFKFLHE